MTRKPNRKLTPSEDVIARQLRQSGWSYAKIASHLQSSSETIRNICLGKSREKMGPKIQPLVDRFWPKVKVQPSGCWEWQGSTNTHGYGRIGIGSRSDRSAKMTSTHRLSWSLVNGSIPDGMCVLHHCDNPPCVNPEHLFLGTVADNSADMVAKGRGVSPAAVLTPDMVRVIRSACAAGIDRKVIARAFGVNPASIYRVARGATWADVA